MFVDGITMKEYTGKYRISFKIIGDDEGESEISLGVVPQYAEWDQDPFIRGGLGSGMYLNDGALFGNGKVCDHAAGKVNVGQIVGMELDTDAHTLKFWVDDKPHGPGYTRRVAGSLRWAMSATGNRDVVHIVSNVDISF